MPDSGDARAISSKHPGLPGVYRASIRLPEPGSYDLSVALDEPRAALCLVHAIEGEAEADTPTVVLEPAFAKDHALEAGSGQRLRFRAKVPAGAPLRADEVAVLAFRPPGTWQWRGTAARATGDEIEILLPPASPGRMVVVLGVPGRGVPLGALPSIELPVRSIDTLAEEATP